MYQNITVGIKTFLRPHSLDKCLGSLLGFNFSEVIVADDSGEHLKEEYDAVYRKYEPFLPLRIIALPFDAGASQGRNSIATACKTEFLLVLDDDEMINETLSLKMDVLNSDPTIGGVSSLFKEFGQYKCSACDIYVEDGYVIKELRRKYEIYTTHKGTRYAFFDFLPSSTLFRLQCLKDSAWDPSYKIGSEHLDFFFSHKQLGKWKFAIAFDAYTDHEPTNTGEYHKYRKGKERIAASRAYFSKKFGALGKIEGKKLLEIGETLL